MNCFLDELGGLVVECAAEEQIGIGLFYTSTSKHSSTPPVADESSQGRFSTMGTTIT